MFSNHVYATFHFSSTCPNKSPPRVVHAIRTKQHLIRRNSTGDQSHTADLVIKWVQDWEIRCRSYKQCKSRSASATYRSNQDMGSDILPHHQIRAGFCVAAIVERESMQCNITNLYTNSSIQSLPLIPPFFWKERRRKLTAAVEGSESGISESHSPPLYVMRYACCTF